MVAPALRIFKCTVTPFEQNARILCDEQGTAMVVDPGGDVPRLLEIIKGRSLNVASVFLTHSHLDHVGGLRRLLAELSSLGQSPLVYGHRLEADLRRSVSEHALYFGLSPSDYETAKEPDVYIEDRDNLVLGALSGTLLFTPGHSPGHLSLYFESLPFLEITVHSDGREREQRSSAPVLIAGDALFAGSIGRTDLPGGNHQQLLESIRERIFTLPEDTIVMPGHGPNTSVGVEKKSNPFCR